MQNLLPFEEKKKILTEYRLRLGVVSLFAIATLILLSLILLAPSYFLTLSKSNVVAEELAQLESRQKDVAQEKDIDAQIKEINKKVDLFLGTDKIQSIGPSEFLQKVLSIRTSAIRITSIMYDVNPSRARVVIIGSAANRESLSDFVDLLKKEGTFNKVELPISSYVKSTNIDFSIVLERATTSSIKK